jgi:NAD(P)H-flavin reductase
MACRLLAVAVVALGAGVGAIRGADAAKAADQKSAVAPVKDKDRAKKGGTSGSDIRKLHEELSKERDIMIADFDALMKQMKDATEEQKKQIKEKMEAQKKAFEVVTNALHKRIREEQRKERQNAPSAKR